MCVYNKLYGINNYYQDENTCLWRQGHYISIHCISENKTGEVKLLAKWIEIWVVTHVIQKILLMKFCPFLVQNNIDGPFSPLSPAPCIAHRRLAL